MKKIHTALTIAGLDPSGGAGLQADLKTFAAYGVAGKSVATSITIQNTNGVNGVHDLPADIVVQQLAAILDDGKPQAVKTGMLGNDSIVEGVTRVLRRHRVKNLVVDPVIRSSSGKTLLSAKGVKALKERLLPAALLVTPNLAEAEKLSGVKIRKASDRIRAARALLKWGVKNVLITGGHLRGKPQDFFYDGGRPLLLDSNRLAGGDVHGTGCVLASAVAAGLAQGLDIISSVREAKEFVGRAIAGAIRSGEGLPQAEPLAGLYQSGERYYLFERVLASVEILKQARIGHLIPEVQSNMGIALEGARTLEDVIGFPGRIVKCGEDIVWPVPPRFGGSRHVADIVLTVMQFDPSKRAVMNIKYSENLIKICRGLKFKIGSFDRSREPRQVRTQEGSSLEWGTAHAIRRCGFVPDIVFDKGGVGKEEMIRVIAEDVESLTGKILKIHRGYLKSSR
ncbi:phosphomethylpyrimidine kinase [Candidatus Nitromaritima sp. SCGC AAA799-A02]|nr:phosphomethylpyrimidine kinase [Candidatus Nitromaritima sp. SCGC AAA799-A02]